MKIPKIIKPSKKSFRYRNQFQYIKTISNTNFHINTNSNNAFNRLYDDAKYKETYLTALKFLYNLKEKEECPFQPKINKGNFNRYYNNSFLLNNKIAQFNRHKRNCLTNDFERNSFSIHNTNQSNNYYHNKKKISNLYNLKKNNDKSLFNSVNSSFYNTLTKTQVSPSSISNKLINKTESGLLYSNNFSDLNPKLTFKTQYNIPNSDKMRSKSNEGILSKRICNSINSIPLLSKENLLLTNFNSITPTNEASAISSKNNRYKLSFNNKNIKSNSESSSQRNSNSNIFVSYEDNKKNDKNIQSFKHKLNKNKSHILLKLDMNNPFSEKEDKKIKTSYNISNSTGTNDKYSFANEQLSVRAAYPQNNNNITLQSIPDEALFAYADNFINSEDSVDSFKNNKNLKKKF